jgi:Lrp/AsnC family transcriptional regulator for asnA, asnC and gidA
MTRVIKVIPKGGNGLNYEIDDLDKGIMKLLSKDGRMSFTEIAGKLNVSEKTVRTRYKNLVDHEILGVVGVINPIPIGLKSGAILQIKVEPKNLQNVIMQLKMLKGIRYLTLTSGSYQLLAQVIASSQNEITDFIL